MKRAIQLISWTLLLYILLLVFMNSIGKARIRMHKSFFDYFVFETDQGLEVLSDFELVNQFTGGIEQALEESIHVRCRRESVAGPLPGLFECTVRYSFLPDPESLVIFHDEDLTQQQQRTLYDAIVAHARADPDMDIYRPGQPVTLRLSMGVFVLERFEILMILCVSPMFVLGVNWLVGKAGKRTHDQRRQLGVCVHCEYECTNLPSPICPECGHLHKAEVVPTHA